jgi:hypothetical protein
LGQDISGADLAKLLPGVDIVLEEAVVEGAVVEGAVVEGAVVEGAVVEGDILFAGEMDKFTEGEFRVCFCTIIDAGEGIPCPAGDLLDLNSSMKQK